MPKEFQIHQQVDLPLADFCLMEPVDKLEQGVADAGGSVLLVAQGETWANVVFNDAQPICSLRDTLTPDLGQSVPQSRRQLGNKLCYFSLKNDKKVWQYSNIVQLPL